MLIGVLVSEISISFEYSFHGKSKIVFCMKGSACIGMMVSTILVGVGVFGCEKQH